MNVTYRDTKTDETVVYTAPVPGLERSSRWERVEGPAYAKLLKPELQALCVDRGLDGDGTVPVLRERLEAYDAEQSQA